MFESDKNPTDFRQRLEQQSTSELIELALTADDEGENSGWEAIWVLRYRATREVFEAARTLCANHDANKRKTGVDILAQHGIPVRIYLDETIDLFLRLIETEEDVQVLNSLGTGLGHIFPEPRKVKPLLKLKNHPHPDVRFGAAFGLQGEEDPLAIRALIELSADEDDDVRDWATFRLGTQIEVDTPEIRQALFNRAAAGDDSSTAPEEALVGLARRQDERAFGLILKRLQAGYDGTLILEAAELLADVRLYPALVKLRENPDYSNYERKCLETAIAACRQPA
jgi:HEAT repeat protein